jgi:nitrite reductase/ring-hydroxylating ferredoxin subunit
MKDAVATPLQLISSRREFCTHACHAAAAVAIGSVLQGCGGGGGGSPSGPSIPSSTPLAVVNGTVAGGAITLNVDGSPLSSVGGSALVRSSAGDVLTYRTAQDAFSAVTAMCTHEACTITGINGQTYVCPCHGSQFSITGSVVSGPATRSLRTYSTSLAGTTLSIAL